MKNCKIPDCEKPAGVPGTAHGWCSKHYNRWKRTGDPLLTLTDLKPPADPLCSVEGCETPRWARGYCGTHYRRFMSSGDPGAAERLTKPATGRCSVQGCRRKVRSRDLCQRHYLRKWRHGSPLGGATEQGLHDRCRVANCPKEYYALGLCHAHWAVVSSGYQNHTQRIGAPPVGTCTPDQLVARLGLYGNRCWMCGDPADQVDHVKPLSAGGPNWPANLRPSCAGCNYRKGSKWPLPNLITEPITAPKEPAA